MEQKLTPTCISNDMQYKMWDEMDAISFNTLSRMWLLIHAGIKVIPCK